jgi:predicted  nucleic acid-binding Zn-ribbon protein
MACTFKEGFVEKTPFQMFIDLINFDQEIEHLNQKRKNIEQEIIALDGQGAHLQKELTVLRYTIHEAKKRVDATELDMKSLDLQEKEYKSLKTEIERMHQQQHDLEQELLVAWKQLENAQKVHEEKTQEINQKIEQSQTVKQEKQDALQQLNHSIREQSQTRPQKEKNIPAEWLEKYAVMRSQVTDPVVPVHNGSCSACYYKVVDNDLQQLRRNKLLQCKDCYRFLYLESPSTQVEQP